MTDKIRLQRDIDWLLDTPDGSIASYHDAGSCWALIEALVVRLRANRTVAHTAMAEPVRLITAAEWTDEYTADMPPGSLRRRHAVGFENWAERIQRNAEQHALERAAKVVESHEDFRQWAADECASAIRALIREDLACAAKETNDGPE